MPVCGIKFVNQIRWIFDLNQLIAKAKTAVVVKKRPTAAVAVSRDRFIVISVFLEILIIYLD